ncbi:MAG: 5-(carboxyamino)imidazole ribonucleotide mutase [Methanobrevibacter woesei]|nr:5-(carboxyamino)imidazole ribonucleotide mutase [Methanobrevibacter woesei]
MVPKVMIILGSGSDIDIAKKSINILEKLEIPYSLKVASAHRTHSLVKTLVKEATEAGVEVFIGIAGLAAHLPGIISAYTHRPVIGVPVKGAVGGIDALYASVQVPYPTPVATVGINRGDNAAILAAQFIGIHDPKVAVKISELRNEYATKVIDSNYTVIDEIEGNYIDKDFLDIKSLKIEEKEIETCRKYNYDAKVAVLAGNYSDIVIAKKVAIILDRLKIEHDMQVLCPIRHPEAFENYVKGMKNVDVFIGISSNSSIITGGLCGLTEKPVIGVPCGEKLGIDSLLSMVNMPPGVPVATVGVNNGRNAAILAGEILAVDNPDKKVILEKTKNKKMSI